MIFWKIIFNVHAFNSFLSFLWKFLIFKQDALLKSCVHFFKVILLFLESHFWYNKHPHSFTLIFYTLGLYYSACWPVTSAYRWVLLLGWLLVWPSTSKPYFCSYQFFLTCVFCDLGLSVCLFFFLFFDYSSV